MMTSSYSVSFLIVINKDEGAAHSPCLTQDKNEFSGSCLDCSYFVGRMIQSMSMCLCLSDRPLKASF